MKTLERLRGGLIVSVQAWSGSAIDDPLVLSAMAAAAQASGAAGVRMQGTANLRAARARLTLPMIGIIKIDYPGFAPYITPTPQQVREVAASGAEIVAFDATPRPRPDGSTVEALVAAVHAAGCIAMADCATAGDALCALAAGARSSRRPFAVILMKREGRPCRHCRCFVNSPNSMHLSCAGGLRRPGDVEAAFGRGRCRRCRKRDHQYGLACRGLPPARLKGSPHAKVGARHSR